MRTLWVLLVLLAIPAASAQSEFDFSNDYHARVAVGDVPLTAATEAEGLVHTVEYLKFSHDGNNTVFAVPASASSGCTCPSFSKSGDSVTVGNTVEAGDYVFWIRNEAPAATTFGVSLAWSQGTGQVVIYHAANQQVTGPGGQTLDCASTCVGQFTFFDGNLDEFWASVHPATVTPEGPVVTKDSGFGYLELAIGLVLGVLVWFWLVQKGFVQARSRKQVVAKSAHEEVALAESQDMLAARKRVLMAGLKELEIAKMKAEMDDATYDKLKAELKKEAVTTMRAMDRE